MTLATQIKNLLDDDSFPSMVKLDGDWGSGKTYYTERTLIPELRGIYTNKNIIYFSLFGLSNLNDFRDKLISASYLSDKADPSWIEQAKNSALGIFKAFDADDAGTIGNILKTSSGAIKHALMAKLKNLIIVLDDLERLNDETFKIQIIGECLHLAEENKLSFIFVLNSAEIKLNNALLEKSFAGKIKFCHSKGQLFDIAFERYSELAEFKTSIVRLIEKYELENLRVLKRVSFKLNEIYVKVKDIKDIDISTTIEGFAKDLIRIACLHYSHEKSVEDIYSALEINLIKAKAQTQRKNESDKATDQQENFFNQYRDYYPPTEQMVDYCCNESQLTSDINELGKIVLKTNPIDQLLFNHSSLYSDNFDQLVVALNNLISQKKNVPIKRWFEASEFYTFLIKNKFVEDQNLTEFISRIKSELNEKEFYRDTENNYYTFKLNNSDIASLYEKHSSLLETKDAENADNQLLKKIKISWQEVDEHIYKNYQSTCFVNKYSADQWLNIINDWPLKELNYFTDFIRERYRAQNIHNNLTDETSLLKELDQLISKEITSLSGQKKGLYTMLHNAIERGIDQLSASKETD